MKILQKRDSTNKESRFVLLAVEVKEDFQCIASILRVWNAVRSLPL